MLLELADGYQLGDVSTDDTFAHLSIFVQRLVREDERELLAWNPIQDEALYRISANMVESSWSRVSICSLLNAPYPDVSRFIKCGLTTFDSAIYA